MPTLICEDGTGLANANSYASLEYANVYFEGNTAWAGEEDTLTRALAIAFDSMEQLYGPKYLGALIPTSQQAALFPRLSFVDNRGRLISSNMVPACLLRAQCEIALLYLQGADVFPQRSTEQHIAQQSVSLGDLSTSTTYSKAVEGESFPGFRKVDLLLDPILTTSSQSCGFLSL